MKGKEKDVIFIKLEIEMKRIWIPQAITIIMLIIALNPANPYGYYILLRLVCCSAYVYLTLKSLELEKEGWPWVLGVTAIVYNPIIRIHLTRDIWVIINLISIGISIASIVVMKNRTCSTASLEDKNEIGKI